MLGGSRRSPGGTPGEERETTTRIILYSGKGGVGKTSLAAATAVRAARLGRRTLVVSTDAAHSLADALAVPVAASPRPSLPGLDALEIDVNRELASHWGIIQEWLTRFMTFQGVDGAVAEEMAILPGMEELFSLLKVKRVRRERAPTTLIIIDCAPTGETVRMLGVPEILGFYFKRIFPIQRTVLGRAAGGPAHHRHAAALRRRVRRGAGHLPRARGHGAAAAGPGEQLHPHRAEPRAHGDQRVAAPLHVPQPLRVPGGRGDRQPRAAAGGALELLRALVRHPGRPPGRGARASFDPLPFFEARLFDREMVGTAAAGRVRAARCSATRTPPPSSSARSRWT